MDAQEYLAFIPLLIYGIAIADLLDEWRRLFYKKDRYLPYVFMTIVFTETAIYNVFIYINLLDELVGQTYLSYLKYLMPPVLFLLMVRSFTPEKNDDTKAYFIKTMPMFLTLFAVFVAVHFLFDFQENIQTILGRIFAIIAILATGYFRKTWIIYFLVLLWFVIFTMRFDLITT